MDIEETMVGLYDNERQTVIIYVIVVAPLVSEASHPDLPKNKTKNL